MDTTTLPIRPTTAADLTALVGEELGPTEWYEITQKRVNAFADATGDHQWIHVDVEKAAASTLGGTIAHGLFSLSLGPYLSSRLLTLEDFAHGLNYGYNKVRFPAPVPVGSRVRMRVTVVSAEELPGGIQVTTAQVVECEGSDKPVMIAESVGRVIPHPDHTVYPDRPEL
ncbi:MaoC family dehydratase [Rhodococcus opacus]|uniref:MaoC family dehydratase n=1 Tax=Rhodococcus opacus TaxID=37919 RepID=UPI0002A1BF69|nr:MaoC family dehydratase [Rhodococcus opacus]ELB87884.1 enoyl-CoA hydratase [Rhodococcus wratislaviensis IFP 2016]MBA8964495.1 acyl dehydratase [Rhodococcus opacus]MBP2207542.1 acyl dehydratase [Rhodococcus opacus]MDJ0419080.1 MaoC family dehydratase [Rhodococcus opacus]MDX5965511.1 MaoC family dehydratase [Rhodococcus opacus]